jgi:hypothetical protein
MAKMAIVLDLTTMQLRRLVESLEEEMDATSNVNAYEAYYQVAKAIADRKGWELASRTPEQWEQDQSEEWRQEQQEAYDDANPSLPDMPLP